MSIEKIRTYFREPDTAEPAKRNAANPANTAGVNPAEEPGRYSSSFSGRLDVCKGWREGEPC